MLLLREIEQFFSVCLFNAEYPFALTCNTEWAWIIVKFA